MAGATAATILTTGKALAAENAEAHSIKIPDEFAQAAKTPPVKVNFLLTLVIPIGVNRKGISDNLRF